MKTIKPTYVTFNQAKLLKENGFDELCSLHWEWGNGDKKHNRLPALFIGGFVDEDGNNRKYRNSELMKDYSENGDLFGEFSAPEQWQVIEWIELMYQKYVYAFRYNGIWQYKIDAEHGCDYFSKGEGYTSKKEAYSAAFDYFLSTFLITFNVNLKNEKN